MLRKKIARQPKRAIRRPPSEGPRAGAYCGYCPQEPHAAAGPWLRNCLANKRHGESHHNRRSEALRCAAAINSQSPDATPHRPEAAVNRKVPAISKRRRPVMSPSRPTLTINVVVASR